MDASLLHLCFSFSLLLSLPLSLKSNEKKMSFGKNDKNLSVVGIQYYISFRCTSSFLFMGQ